MPLQEGQIIPDHCCQGWEWEVLLVLPSIDSVWGRCQNPDCPRWEDDPSDPYRGVSNAEISELEDDETDG